MLDLNGKGSGNGSFPWRKDWENHGFPRVLIFPSPSIDKYLLFDIMISG